VEHKACLREFNACFRVDSQSKVDISLEARLEVLELLGASSELPVQRLPRDPGW
jgi:hypothetical protein